MTLKPELENLVKTGVLKREAPNRVEFDGLIKSGVTRLKDAKETNVSLEGRFDLAYNASHAIALAALRWHGYRPEKRYVVFQLIGTTLGLGREVWRVLDTAHGRRNDSEYEGDLNVDEPFLSDVIGSIEKILVAALALPAIE